MQKEFCEAAELGDLPRLKSLLAEDPSLVSCRWEGATALHFAALRGRLDCIEFLLRNGADINALDEEFGSPAIGWANETGKMRAVDLLEIRGAVISLRQAAAFGRLDRVEKLIESSPELMDVKDGYGTPLHAAVLWGQYEVVRFLIGAGADINALTEDALTALQLAHEQSQNPRRRTPIISEVREQEIRRECARIVEYFRHSLAEQRNASRIAAPVSNQMQVGFAS